MSFWSLFTRTAKTAPLPESPGAGGNGQIPTLDNTTLTPMSTGRVLLIHGYSADWKGFVPWRDALRAAGVKTVPIAVGNYVTLNNEVSIKDIGEGFDRALRKTTWSSGTKDDLFTFDAIVHSTGMLVLRQWLTSDPFIGTDDPRSRIRRLKHLIGLAPATFGSPQAKKGRSWLGAVVKGNRDFGPDFLNAGNRVLDGLELASNYTWNLAHKDMITAKPLYDKTAASPYVTVFIGNQGYTGLAALSNSPGADGTVRWAGCALNTRKISIDFRREPKLKDLAGNPILDQNGYPGRYFITHWANERIGAPMIAVDSRNHGTILADPDIKVRDLLVRFLHIATGDGPMGYAQWEKDALAFGATGIAGMDKASVDGGAGGAGWQQLLVHMIDDHGDPVQDYNVQLFIGDDLTDSDQVDDTPPKVSPVPLIADTYTGDASYRCFYIRLSPQMLTLNQAGAPPKKMWIELIASSGTPLVGYEAYTGGPGEAPKSLQVDHEAGTPVKMEITALAQGDDSLLYPYTTTLLEIFVEREPTPLSDISDIFKFIQDDPTS